MRRFPIQPNTPPEQFGLLAWLAETRITLPLQAVDCRFEICGPAAYVTLDQRFVHTNPQPLDCTYTFPLPADAATHQCRVTVNERVIEARVEDEVTALELYAVQKAAGHRVALVRGERENLFTLELGNVQPGDAITVRFAYFQELARTGDSLSIAIPFCPGIRYIPGKRLLRSNAGRGTSDDTDQVPDASRISPPRIPAEHPDAAELFISGSIHSAATAIADLSSPTHPILVRTGPTDSDATIELAQEGTVPDRNFVVRWREVGARKTAQNRGWSYTTPEGSVFALVELIAPRDVEVASDGEGQDVYFLLDRSGSMSGDKWVKTADAFLRFLRLLGPRDRAWCTVFESAFSDIAEQPLPAAVLLADPAVQSIAALGTGGGTELYPALEHVLRQMQRHSAQGRSPALILITDGQVGNEAKVATLLQSRPELSVHTFGIDLAVNDAFLQDLARQHGGSCVLMTPQDDIGAAIAALAERLRRPVVRDLQLEAGHPWQLPRGERIPSLFANTVTTIRLAAPRSGAEPVHISGRLPDGRPYEQEIDPEPTSNAALALLWIKSEIRALQRTGSNADQATAIDLAKKYNILCRGTSFIGWDTIEQVPIAQHSLYQPSMAAGGGFPEMRMGQTMMLCAHEAYSDVRREAAPLLNGPVLREPAPLPNPNLERSAPARKLLSSLREMLAKKLVAVDRIRALSRIDRRQVDGPNGSKHRFTLDELCEIIPSLSGHLWDAEKANWAEVDKLQARVQSLLSAVAPDLLPDWEKLITCIDQLRPAHSVPK